MDGTFRVAPSQFYQIYTISIEHEGYSLPVCWAFLGRATADLLRAILTRFQELDIQMEPKTIFTDFEAAMISAVGDYFYHHAGRIRHKLCFFHLSQSVWRRTQKKYDALYKKDPNFSCAIRAI